METGGDHSNSKFTAQGEEDEVAETDPEARYYRYKEHVGKGRFKQTYKAFDTQLGIDVAWSKISGDSLQLSPEQLQIVAEGMQIGLEVDHPNIIKCYRCWVDHQHKCINLITELFTSGNLRHYRNLHKTLDSKAIKRMARQILKGLAYLHNRDPPVTHGDLRCDKIYVNGNIGEIKIGDLGLATLLPLRYENSQAPSFTPASDIYAFGLCLLELFTLKQLDMQHCSEVQAAVDSLPDEDQRAFISKCLGPEGQRPRADQLMDDPFLVTKKVTGTGEKPPDVDLDASGKNLGDSIIGSFESQIRDARKQVEELQQPEPAGEVTVGKLRGEDYVFEFKGELVEGKLQFRLQMVGANDAEEPKIRRTIDFVYDPEVDTADNLAQEISQEFDLSPTDKEICAAGLKEWLARELPGRE